jgi:hypothetical protein
MIVRADVWNDVNLLLRSFEEQGQRVLGGLEFFDYQGPFGFV